MKKLREFQLLFLLTRPERTIKIEGHTENKRDKKGDLMKAIPQLKKALAINPNYARAHNQLGIAYYYDGQYKLALDHCNRALELGWRVNPKLLELLKPYR